MIILNNFFSVAPTSSSCLHNQGSLERRNNNAQTKPKPSAPSANSTFKLGLPGLPPIASFTKPAQQPAAYYYYCRNCKKQLPTAQNLLWDTFYVVQQASKIQSAISSSSVAGKKAGTAQPAQPGSKPAKPKREPIPAKLRYDILTRDKYRCVKCGAAGSDGTKLHIDHKKPVSQGGTNHPSNLQTLCEKCNLGKGARQG